MKSKLMSGLGHVCLFCVFLFNTGKSVSQSNYYDSNGLYVGTEAANKDFKELQSLTIYDLNDTSYRSEDPVVRAHYSAKQQKKYMLYRETGIKFWRMYRDDPRKYDWFRSSFGQNANVSYWFNHYWKYIDSGAYQHELVPLFTSYSTPVDFNTLNRHEKLYPAMQAEYFRYIDNDSALSIEQKALRKNNIRVAELENFLKISRNIQYRQGKKIDLIRLRKLITSAFPIPAFYKVSDYGRSHWGGVLDVVDSRFVAVYEHFGLTADDLNKLIKSFATSNNENLRYWSGQVTSLLTLEKEPMAFRHEATNGKIIDLKQLRGKVVLLDFWSTSCGTCIKRMPAIKQVYDKYKSQGFEVISLCLNYGDETEEIEKIEEKIGSDWPILMIGSKNKEDYFNSTGAKLFKKYGFVTVPQLFLLDKQGKLRMLNGVLRDGDFEPIVKRLLNESYKENNN